MKIAVLTLGCKVNSYESDSIAKALRDMGHVVSEKLEKADIFIINTCAVTGEAEKKSRQMVARALKFNKKAKVIICGCAAQNNSEQFKDNNITLIKGVFGKGKIPYTLDLVGKFVEEQKPQYENDFHPMFLKTRAYVKIQDGCNNFCSYCLIPYVRGRSRSRDLNSIVQEMKDASLVSKEIVITGINVSDFRIDDKLALPTLIDAINGIESRFRFGSLEVNVITKELLEKCLELKGFCPHFHLSLQSGCDETLKAMNRKYDTKLYFEKVQLIRKYFPNAAITTDLIVGYPTETEEQFVKTLCFTNKVEFSDMHIFAYSSRNGTVASKLKVLNPSIIKERLKRANEICDKNKNKYLNSFNGSTLNVLIEEYKDGYYTGYDMHYNRVCIKDECLVNQVVEVKAMNNDGKVIFAKL